MQMMRIRFQAWCESRIRCSKSNFTSRTMLSVVTQKKTVPSHKLDESVKNTRRNGSKIVETVLNPNARSACFLYERCLAVVCCSCVHSVWIPANFSCFIEQSVYYSFDKETPEMLLQKFSRSFIIAKCPALQLLAALQSALRQVLSSYFSNNETSRKQFFSLSSHSFSLVSWCKKVSLVLGTNGPWCFLYF